MIAIPNAPSITFNYISDVSALSGAPITAPVLLNPPFEFSEGLRVRLFDASCSDIRPLLFLTPLSTEILVRTSATEPPPRPAELLRHLHL